MHWASQRAAGHHCNVDCGDALRERVWVGGEGKDIGFDIGFVFDIWEDFDL